MFSSFVLVCFIAKMTLTSCTNVDSSALLENQREVPASPKEPELIKLLQKIDELEKRQASLMEEIGLLHGVARQKRGDTQGKQKRMRRSASDQDGIAQLPTAGCIPGTNGCPVSVTPFSIAGSCILCPAGPRGYPGSAGPPGRDGRDAIAVITNSGDQGLGGSHVPSQPDARPASNTSGAVYIRWGHHSCPSTSTLIYSGSAVAPHYSAAGNGADQLCLPGDPIYDEPVSGVGGSRAFLYSLEYQIDTFPTRNDRLWYDVPCAVCKAPSRFSKLMIPGKNTCPDEEWTREYGGYLMAERSHTNHQRSLHICVDREMEILDRTSGYATNYARGLLNLVESRCSSSGGGIPCGPYIDGYEMTCAVCTL